ncbi:hypothetical protein CFC21_107962 [Triticum aestivum]|uniref:Zinc finger-XS domain-containing protein n=2 Tax=Triticum aestivum TaxID=4565 RepID=A0A3B6TB10_WHEAT|nr:hypothetical protein CFC21_107962 [Triticum aestivum]
MEQGRGAAAAAHGVVVEAVNTAADAVQEVAAVGGAGDVVPAVAGAVAVAADLVEQGVVGSDSVVPDLVVTASGGALDVGAEASDKQVVDVEEEAAGTKRKLAITGFNDPYDSDYDDDDNVYEYKSGDEVDDWNQESFIEHEAEKIREKGKVAYYKWGKFRCPYCTTKPIPKDGLYEHLMLHARGLATSGNHVKIRVEHATLLKAMGTI